MKKVLLVLVIIIVILLAVFAGGYLVFKDELDVLQEGVEDGSVFKSISQIIEVQNKEYVKIDEDTYIMKTNSFKEQIDSFIEKEYDVVKMQDVDTMILYESKDQSKVVTVTFTQYNLYTLFNVQEKAGKGTEFTITFNTKKSDGIKVVVDEKKSEDYDYNIYTYNGKIDIKVKMRTKELKDALKDGDITMERIISQAENDAAAGLITATTFDDGGTKIYQYGTYTILKQNTLDGVKDVYIGPFGMQYEDVIEVEDEEKESDTKKK